MKTKTLLTTLALFAIEAKASTERLIFQNSAETLLNPVYIAGYDDAWYRRHYNVYIHDPQDRCIYNKGFIEGTIDYVEEILIEE